MIDRAERSVFLQRPQSHADRHPSQCPLPDTSTCTKCEEVKSAVFRTKKTSHPPAKPNPGIVKRGQLRSNAFVQSSASVVEASRNAAAVAAKLASSNLTFEAAYGREAQQSTTQQSKGSWLARVSHRASHIPNRPLTSTSRDTLALHGSSAAGFRSHEQLPGMSKTTISHPASPSNLSSPTETEFGHTPIDASFGDRIENPPPDRPLPDRPTLRTGQSTQRSRSGTATQTDIATRLTEDKMDRYALPVRDNGYDSDGEADDEYDRSDLGILSPNEAEHYDDDQSDHPSESEEEHPMMDGDDTPRTEGWGDREGRSPTGKITQWNEEQVADYISSLGLKMYSQTFADELVTGDALIVLHHDELRELGVNSVGHRLTILKAVYEQKVRAGVKLEEGDYVPLSAEGDKSDLTATQDDITRVIESIKLRDQRIIATELELRQLKQDLDRISEENRKLREETLPIMRLVKDQRTPLPDPSGGTLPSPRDAAPPAKQEESKGSSLSRKFSTKKLFLGSAPKQPSPTHPPPSSTQTQTLPQAREVREDVSGGHLEASAAAVAASSHLTASMTSQASPNSVHSPTSPYSTQALSSGGSYHYPTSTPRSFQRDGGAASSRLQQQHSYDDGGPGTGTGYSTNSQWSQASTVVADSASTLQRPERRRGQPSPREDDGGSTRERG